jgi:hypothetical protein
MNIAGSTAVNTPSTLSDFLSLVRQYCMRDAELRHEIERVEYYGFIDDRLRQAFPLYLYNELSVREAFGMTRRDLG